MPPEFTWSSYCHHSKFITANSFCGDSATQSSSEAFKWVHLWHMRPDANEWEPSQLLLGGMKCIACPSPPGSILNLQWTRNRFCKAHGDPWDLTNHHFWGSYPSRVVTYIIWLWKCDSIMQIAYVTGLYFPPLWWMVELLSEMKPWSVVLVCMVQPSVMNPSFILPCSSSSLPHPSLLFLGRLFP